MQTHPQIHLGRAFLLATAAVLLVRLWVLLQLADSPFFSQDHGDSAYYLRWAARVAAGQWTDGQAFLGLPLYPYFLACLQLLQLPFPWAPLLFQAGFDALTGGLIFLAIAATAEPSKPRSTLLCASVSCLGWIFFRPAQAFAATLMPNPPATLAFTGFLVLLIVRWHQGHRWTAFQALGVGGALGFVTLLSANLLFLLPLLAVALWPPPEEPRSRLVNWVGRSGLLVVGLAAGSSPAWVHNRFVAGEPVALSAHSGINFYIGNNPLATGYPNFPPGIRASQEGLLEDSARLAEARLGRPLRRYEVSAYWNAEAAKFISENPGLWARIIFAKIRNYYSNFEYDDISVIRPLRMLGVTTMGWGFGTLVVVAAGGLVLGRSRPSTRWAAAAVALHTLSVLPAFVTERYRLMAVPALLMVAGTGWLHAWQARSLGPLSWTGAAGAMLLAGWVVTSAPRPGGVDTLADYNAAVRLLAAGERELALPLVQRIEQSEAANAEVALMLGNFWQEAGENARALDHYRRAIERDPQLLRAWNNAAVLAIAEAHWPLAEQLVAHLQKAAPADSRVAYYTAQIALARNDLPAAQQALDRALQLRPDEPLYRALEQEISRRRNP
ncbi:MAG: hypothetical protein JSR82_17615 [Verrucomicrobia bacterium]|nr:hypothetical protein [Verrucomicrobiota bacterium]